MRQNIAFIIVHDRTIHSGTTVDHDTVQHGVSEEHVRKIRIAQCHGQQGKINIEHVSIAHVHRRLDGVFIHGVVHIQCLTVVPDARKQVTRFARSSRKEINKHAGHDELNVGIG